jgi:predicted alpha/beta superfamily hydrolase
VNALTSRGYRMSKPTLVLRSSITGTDYWIFVERPGGTGPWPAVAFLDGDDQFQAAVTAYHPLSADSGVRPLLLVGVGYGASYAKPANKRGRDYTPVNHADEPASGRADDFLKFLTQELWPELGRRYPLDAAAKGLAGHSLGALLVLHALFQPQPFFTHFLASAPSIWWADRAILRQAAELRSRQDRLPGRLFLSVGEEDSASMTGDLALLERQLAAWPFEQLEVVSRRFAQKNHYDVLPAAFEAGLKTLFATP